MYKTKTINVSKRKGPVTVEIRAKNATAGKFEFAIETEAEPGYNIIYRGKFGDYIPDVFMVPIRVSELNNHSLFMIGNFAPGSPDSGTISFDINFYQSGSLVGTAPLQKINTLTLFVNYTIKFKVKD